MVSTKNRAELNYPQWFAKASNWCSRQERCMSDFKTKCYQWSVPEEFRDRLRQELIEAQLIDDERFARSFISGHLRIKGWGASKIRAALSQKGISGELVTPLLSEMEGEEWDGALKKALEKALRNGHKLSDKNHTIKLVKHLMSKGFAYEEVRKVIKPIDD
jgi:regulatory protein